MNLFAELISGFGVLLLPVAAGLLFEELTFGGLARLLLAPRPGTGKRGPSSDGTLSLECKRGEHTNQNGGAKCSH